MTILTQTRTAVSADESRVPPREPLEFDTDLLRKSRIGPDSPLFFVEQARYSRLIEKSDPGRLSIATIG